MKIFEKSKFIWINDTGKDIYAEFYGKFYGKCDTLCRISCDGDYTLYVNGQYVSSNQYGDFEHYKSYDELNLTPYLNDDINHFAVLCHHFGDNSSRYKRYDAGVIFEVIQNGNIVLASDDKILSRKSTTYVSGRCKKISSQLGFSYTYDRKNQDFWTLGQLFDFKNATLVNKNCNFIKRPNKKLVNDEFIEAKEVKNENNTHILYDLGAEYVGLLSFEIESGTGDINIAYGESLTDGHVRRILGDRDFSIDYLSCESNDKFTNYMLRFACRYLEISATSPVIFKKIGLIKQYYPVRALPLPQLSESDAKIYSACLNTLKLSMMEHYVDCPWREQCLYAFDSRNQMLCGYYAFEDGNRDYARSCLKLMSMDRRDDNLLSICFPCGIDLTIPSFSLHYITAIKEYLEHTNDISLYYEIKEKLLSIFSAFIDNMKGNLVYSFGGANHWNFYDWSPYSEGSLFNSTEPSADGLLNLLFIIALNNYKAICALASDHFPFDELLEIVKASTKERFFDYNKGLFKVSKGDTYTELVNSLGVLSGILNDQEEEFILSQLASGSLISSSLSMKCFKYDALLKDRKKYEGVILDEIRSTYIKMAEATNTVWETALGDSDFGGAGSLCHGWSAIPIYYYHKLLK